MDARLLIASPQMRDPFFERTLVLVWEHTEDGAIGVIINREVAETVADVLDPAPEGVDLEPFKDRKVAWGGPVDRVVGTVITPKTLHEPGSINLDGGLSVSRSMDVLVQLLEEREDFLLCLGYAGWGAGQLDDEIVQGGWLWTDVDARLLFDTPSDERYDKALATLGLTEAMVWMQPIDE